jgi:diguanylate cyclase (GGDEF)-like protein
MYSVESWFLEQDIAQDTLRIWQELVNLMAELCHTPAGFIVQMTEEGYQVVIANRSEENPYPAGGVIPTETNIFCSKVVEQNRPLYVNNATHLKEWRSNPEVSDDHFNSYLGFPLHWPSGKIFGTICVMDFKITNYDDRYHRLLAHFKEMAERELKLLEQNIYIKQLSIHDDLTGLLNRRGLQNKISEHLKLASRHNEDIAVCYYDLDELKKINDCHGHKIGDEAIKTFARALEESHRKTDITARFGGDEFLAIVCIKHLDELTKINERLQKSLNCGNLSFCINYSIGKIIIDSKSLLSIDIEQVISQADKLMYANKRSKHEN